MSSFARKGKTPLKKTRLKNIGLQEGGAIKKNKFYTCGEKSILLAFEEEREGPIAGKGSPEENLTRGDGDCSFTHVSLDKAGSLSANHMKEGRKID